MGGGPPPPRNSLTVNDLQAFIRMTDLGGCQVKKHTIYYLSIYPLTYSLWPVKYNLKEKKKKKKIKKGLH